MSLKPPISPTSGASSVLDTIDGRLDDLEAGSDSTLISATDPSYGMATSGTAGGNATALAAAVAALPTDDGGTVLIPRGTYSINALPSLEGRRSIVIKGEGTSFEFGGYGTTLIYTGAASQAWNWEEAIGCRLEGIQLLYNNASFTGTLLDLSNDAGAGNDTRYCSFRDCMFAGQGVDNAAQLVRLNNAHSIDFDKCAFLESDVAVYGKATNNEFSNAINFKNCLFYNQTVAHVKNPDGAWQFDNCVFEPLADGSPGILRADSGVKARGVAFRSCWAGDISVAGNHIEFRGNGLVIDGGLWAAETAGSQYIELMENDCQGIVLSGVHFKQGSAVIDFGTTTGATAVVLPCHYDTVSAITAGTVPSGFTQFDATTSHLKAGAYVYADYGATSQVRLGTVGGGVPGVLLGSAGDTEIRRLGANIAGTASGDKFVANAGLGVGNSAAGSSLGTVTKKMEVFDAAGASLGFVPIYDAIT